MLVMRITEASVEKLDMNTKESTGETGVLTICEPTGAYYCADDSENRISLSLDAIPDNWKLNEVKELEIDGKRELFRLLNLETNNLTV